MAAPTYKGKNIIDCGATKEARRTWQAPHRWAVYFLHTTVRGMSAEMEYFKTLNHAKAAIDGDLENAL
jgi:hypothetical protein